ncbi:thymidylate synthase [Shewanella sp. 11B5]|uniref:thymidylate synthase n=1 Tax=Shewanella sp. 11B5 TaxID=2058298 RepID=UPI000C796F6F|nr:thymidylate synthase [Shewanella sp. 11B5]PKI11184.1 thymidylate synthase [Shewanella sp. 11B5]
MRIYQGESCNKLYCSALKDCLSIDSPTMSRVGMVYDLGPVAFELAPNKLNLITLNHRAINPFFAIAEAAWVVKGLNSLDTLNYYLKKYDDFSDDGTILNGAYGYRLRYHFGYDQIQFAIDELQKSPESRRCVLNMYSPDDLTNTSSKDIPCNTSIMLKVRDSKLDMTIINRSNDIHRGIPYNFFVFQTLHCFIAREIGIDVGYQRHFTDSLHMYERDIPAIRAVLESQLEPFDICEQEGVGLVYSILTEADKINQKCFGSMTDKSLAKIFTSYSQFKSDKDLSGFVRKTGNPILDFLVSDWLKKYAKN